MFKQLHQFTLILPFFLIVTNSYALEKISLQLPWKYQFEYAGFIAAKEKGFYKEAGLGVTLLEFQSGNMVQDVLSNKVQFGLNASGLAIEKIKGKPVVLVANYLKRAALVLITSQNIYSPHDLVGKKIMGGDEALNTGSLSWMLENNSVFPSSYTRIENEFSTDAFENNKVDAVVAYISNEPYYLKKNNIPFNILDPSNYGVSSTSSNLFTSLSYAKKNPETIRRFVEASNRGWKYALDNKQELINLLISKYPSHKEVGALEYEADLIQNLMYLNAEKIGSIDKKQIIKNIKGHSLNKENALKNFFFSELFKKQNLFTNEEQSYLINKKEITVCIDPDWMPYEEIKNGKHIGMSADYLSYFSENLGIPFKLVKTKTWTETLTKAKQRVCDILSLAKQTPERREFWEFSPSYISTPLVLATSIEQPFIDDIQQVLNKPIGVGKGYAYAELLRNQYPSINLIDTETLDEGLKKVVEGEYFGYLDSLATISYRFQKQYTGQLKISGKFEDKLELSIGVRNDDPILLSVLTKVINAMPEKKHQQITNSWIAVSMQEKIDYGLIWNILLIVFLVLLIGGIWMIKQRHYVLELTNANKKIQAQNSQLQLVSTTDALTQIYNRFKLDAVLGEVFESYQRYNRKYSIILLDIDYFKKVNDEFGHLIGDNVLVEVSQIMKQQIRNTDTLGRWGGEEFMVVCPETNEVEALIVAEKIRKQIRDNKFENNQHITISTGVASVEAECSIDTLLKKADDALYFSKKSGRDRVTSYSSMPK